jgi:hypothetical protein
MIFKSLALFRAWNCFVLFLVVLFLSEKGFSQINIPIIKANSIVVDIKDGETFKKGHWNISPKVKPDVYFSDRCKKQKWVTFYTDIDSIKFSTEPNKTYKFLIVLNGKDTALTEISTIQNIPLKYEKNNQLINDTIPFKLGFNNAIQLKVSINKSQPLDFILDTGANGVILSADALSESCNVKIDSKIKGYNFGGFSDDALSNNNHIQISDLTWKNVPLTIKYQNQPNADGIIGYNIFDGYILEINYEKEILVIHQDLPITAAKFDSKELNFKDGLSYISLSLIVGKKAISGLFDFDTGSDGTLFINNEFAERNKLLETLKSIDSDELKGGGTNKIEVLTSILPKLQFGKYGLFEVPINIEKTNGNNIVPFNIVGNDILKRFHLLIDYKNDRVYFHPNNLKSKMYGRNKRLIIKYSIAFILISLISLIIFLFRKRIVSFSRKIKF